MDMDGLSPSEEEKMEFFDSFYFLIQRVSFDMYNFCVKKDSYNIDEQDVLQKASIAVWKAVEEGKIDVTRTRHEVTGYISTIVKNTAIDMLRRCKKKSEESEVTSLESIAEESHPLYEQVIDDEKYDILNYLSPRQQKIAVMLIDGFTRQEIQDKFKLSAYSLRRVLEAIGEIIQEQQCH